MAKIYIGAVGFIIAADAGESMAGATDRTIEMRTSENRTKSFPAVVNGNNLEYTTLSEDDLDEAGTWFVQPLYTLAGVRTRGETAEMEVFAFFK